MSSSRIVLCAVIAFLAITSCTAANVSSTCSTTHTSTLYTDLASCAWECERDYCQCKGYAYVNGACSGATAITLGDATKCGSTKTCYRSKIACYNEYANMHGRVATPAPPTNATPAPTTAPTPQPFANGTYAPTAQPTAGPPSVLCQNTANTLRLVLVSIGAGTAYAASSVDVGCQRKVCADLSSYAATCTASTLDIAADVCKKDAVRPADATAEVEMRLTGSNIDIWYTRDPLGVKKALRADIAKYLNVDFTFVNLPSLSLGSILMKTKTYGGTEADQQAKLTAMATSGNNFASFTALTGITPTVQLTSLKTDPDSGRRCGKGCIAGAVIGSFFGAVILIAIIVIIKVKVCDKGESTGEKSEPNTENRA